MLPTDAKTRKNMPMARGLLDYFPDALAEVANVSRIGNEQHNPGEPMHWAKEKSTDEADCIIRHLIDRGKIDSDGIRHAAKVAWRALALLQREIEAFRVEPAPMPKQEQTGRWEPGSTIQYHEGDGNRLSKFCAVHRRWLARHELCGDCLRAGVSVRP